MCWLVYAGYAVVINSPKISVIYNKLFVHVQCLGRWQLHPLLFSFLEYRVKGQHLSQTWFDSRSRRAQMPELTRWDGKERVDFIDPPGGLKKKMLAGLALCVISVPSN